MNTILSRMFTNFFGYPPHFLSRVTRHPMGGVVVPPIGPPAFSLRKTFQEHLCFALCKTEHIIVLRVFLYNPLPTQKQKTSACLR